jgi:Tol biopolymer transport system component
MTIGNTNMKKVLPILLFLFGTGSLLAQSDDKVFYSSFRPEGWDIHLSRDNGKSFSPFTNHESLDYDARISPDGKWVVFTSERLGPPHLFIKHIEGDTLPRLLVKSQSMQDQVDFSPDSKWIVFVSTHEGNADIYRLPFAPTDTLAISEAENLTNNPGGDFRPKYSNDGNRIAFSSDREHNTKPHQFFPFAMQRTGDIFTIPAEGGKAIRLTNSDYWEGSPIWSADDSDIYFYSGKDDILSLYKMTATGDDVTSILDFPFDCVSPTSGDNNKLLFTAINDETKAFSVLRIDLETSKIDSTMVQDIDMFNASYHSDGLITFHGGKKPEDTEENKSGFEGDVLVKNNPEITNLIDRPVELFGVRRAFAAPPTYDGMQIVYDHLPARGPLDLMTPFIYPLILIPLFALIWFVIGIVRSIKEKKIYSPLEIPDVFSFVSDCRSSYKWLFHLPVYGSQFTSESSEVDDVNHFGCTRIIRFYIKIAL